MFPMDLGLKRDFRLPPMGDAVLIFQTLNSLLLLSFRDISNCSCINRVLASFFQASLYIAWNSERSLKELDLESARTPEEVDERLIY
jgi:hypothetical protein